jgi:hypothetical protein
VFRLLMEYLLSIIVLALVIAVGALQSKKPKR